MPQLTGSGAALFDCDNDGRLDIFLLQNGGPNSPSTNRLFRQKPDGSFEDRSAGSGLDVAGYGQGVAAGDVNNDGWIDLVVTEYGRVRLFRNVGSGRFTDVTDQSDLENTAWGTSAAFIDYDRDGWLDLVIANYLVYTTKSCKQKAGQLDFCGPEAFQGAVSRLYRNLGVPADSGSQTVRFEDVTIQSGLAGLASPALGVVCADFNGDRWPDIFLANDGKANWLLINQHDGRFKEEATQRGVAYNAMGRAQANMGVAVGDVDGNGLFDLFVTHLTDETHALWQQDPCGSFRDTTAAAHLSAPSCRGTGFGTLLGDFDQDGSVDLAVVNGRVARAPGVPAATAPESFWKPYIERNQLFAGDGAGRFRDVSPENGPFCSRRMVSRGLACGDVDGDGSLDLLVTTIAGPVLLFRNVAPDRGHWLMVRAIDPTLNRDAYGAEITVTAAGRRWVRWLNPGFSYASSNDPRAHFGLGSAGSVDSIEVVWPDGTAELFPGQAADQVVVLRKGDGATPAGQTRRNRP